MPNDVVAKKFKQRGWAVGNRGTDDVCPTCIDENKKAREQEKLANKEKAKELMVPQKVVTLPAVFVANESNAKVIEHVDPEIQLPGELRFKEVVDQEWTTKSNVHIMCSLGKLNPRRTPKGKSFYKISELEKLFGEPGGIRRRPSRRKIEPEIKSTSNERKETMNFDPKAPPTMTKEDRRIIFSEIDSHYLDETRGYDKEWSDERVSKSLNVPLAWVRTIREENFGPERNQSIDAEAEKLRAAIAEAQKLKVEMDKDLHERLVTISIMKKDWEEAKEKINTFCGLINAAMDELKKFNGK